MSKDTGNAAYLYVEKVIELALEGKVDATVMNPFIRTSVDHGTAFDQAGSMTASELCLENAIDYAVQLANNVN